MSLRSNMLRQRKAERSPYTQLAGLIRSVYGCYYSLSIDSCALRRLFQIQSDNAPPLSAIAPIRIKGVERMLITAP
jgi:hypothetical protein